MTQVQGLRANHVLCGATGDIHTGQNIQRGEDSTGAIEAVACAATSGDLRWDNKRGRCPGGMEFASRAKACKLPELRERPTFTKAHHTGHKHEQWQFGTMVSYRF